MKRTLFLALVAIALFNAASAQTFDCNQDSLTNERGLKICDTEFDMQKSGSMGRQISVDTAARYVNFAYCQAIYGNSEYSYSYPRYSSWSGDLNSLLTIGGTIPLGWLCDKPFYCYTIDHVSLDNGYDGTVHYAWSEGYYPFSFSIETNDSMYGPGVSAGSTPIWSSGVLETGDSVTALLPPNSWNFGWPQIATTIIPDSIIKHVLFSTFLPPEVNEPLHMFYIRNADTGAWGGYFELGPASYTKSYVITASKKSQRVAIAYSGGRGDGSEFGPGVQRYTGLPSSKNDNDIYIRTSEDAGTTWSQTRNITMRADSLPGGWAPHAKVSINFDENDVLHVIWQAVAWEGCDAPPSKRARMFHWDELSSNVTLVADANWIPSDCRSGFNQLNLDNPQLSSCDGKLYATFTQFASVPLGRGDDCAARGGYGAANGDLFLSVSADGGQTWDPPRNLTDTYTPDCDADTATPAPECLSDVWASVARYGVTVADSAYSNFPDFTSRLEGAYAGQNYLFLQYINDLDPGSAFAGEGTWTGNPIRTFRFGCVSPQQNARLSSSVSLGRLIEGDTLDLTQSDSTIPWNLQNYGGVGVDDLTITPVNVDPPGNIQLLGATNPISLGPGAIWSGQIVLNAGKKIFLNPARGDIILDGSFDTAPDTISLNYYVLAGCCDTPGDADNSGGFNIGDVTFGIAHIFAGGPASVCAVESDANGDGSFNIADITYSIAHIFSSGPAPICTSGS